MMWITFIGGAWSARLIASGKLILLTGVRGTHVSINEFVLFARACLMLLSWRWTARVWFLFFSVVKEENNNKVLAISIFLEGFRFGFGIEKKKKSKRESPINMTWESVPYSPLDRVERIKWKQGLTDTWSFIIAYLLSFVNSEVSQLLYSLSLSLSLSLVAALLDFYCFGIFLCFKIMGFIK